MLATSHSNQRGQHIGLFGVFGFCAQPQASTADVALFNGGLTVGIGDRVFSSVNSAAPMGHPASSIPSARAVADKFDLLGLSASRAAIVRASAGCAALLTVVGA
jgi:hypothetical protein